MEITSVRVRLTNDQKAPELKAFATIVFDDAFVVHGMKVIEHSSGRLLAMPSRKCMKTGEFKDICHPMSHDSRRRIESVIMAEYDRMLSTEAQTIEQ